jgi:CRP/FNR family transcriptional regulator
LISLNDLTDRILYLNHGDWSNFVMEVVITSDCNVAAGPSSMDNGLGGGSSALHNDLSAEISRKVARISTRRQFEAGAFLFRVGTPAREIYTIDEGIGQSLLHLADGRRAILNFAFAGDVIGFPVPGCHTASTQAITKLTVTCLPIEALKALFHRHPAIQWRFLCKLSDELGLAQRRALALTRYDARQKIVVFLACLDRQSVLHESDGLVRIPTDRIGIADHLGLTIETVSRLLQRLHRSNVISLEGYHKFRITDRAAFDSLIPRLT